MLHTLFQPKDISSVSGRPFGPRRYLYAEGPDAFTLEKGG
jgi:hypothetical protein